jgi:hypothetical protein
MRHWTREKRFAVFIELRKLSGGLGEQNSRDQKDEGSGNEAEAMVHKKLLSVLFRNGHCEAVITEDRHGNGTCLKVCIIEAKRSVTFLAARRTNTAMRIMIHKHRKYLSFNCVKFF